MKFLKKLFAPEIESLSRRLRESDRREGWYLAQIDDLRDEIRLLKAESRSETAATRQREDELIDRVLQSVKLPVITGQNAIEDKAPKISDEDLETLSDRAIDYCIQKYGANYTKEKFDEVFAQMQADPDEWLTN